MNFEKKLFMWVNYYYNKPEIGTTKKIVSEIEHLRKMGFRVWYTAYLDDGIAVFDDEDRLALKVAYGFTDSRIITAIRRLRLVDAARLYIKDNYFDYFYLRINLFDKKYIKMLKEMKAQGAFIMMESLAFFPNYKWYNVQHANIQYYLISFSIEVHKKEIANLVNLMLTEGKLTSFYGVPCIPLGMGIDVDKFEPHHYVGERDELNLIMVGCRALWHGTDRMIEGLYHYIKDGERYGRTYLHLVGGLTPEQEKLIENYHMQERVISYGPKYGLELDEIYNKANIALGPMAQHRMSKKDTGLKTKEYFAKGIPYVYTGVETDIDQNYPFIHNMIDDESPVNILEIWEFYGTIKNCTGNITENMREKAREVFSWEKKFDQIFRYSMELKNKSRK